MASQTQIYYTTQRQKIVFLESERSIATRRYLNVYSKDLSASKGVDNIIEWAFINQDQKPVNLTGKDITARIISSDGNTILLQKSLQPIYVITGLMSLILTSEDLQDVDVQQAFYTIEVSDSTTTRPAFTNTQSEYRGIINIVDGLMPKFMPSVNLTIPDHSPPQSTPVIYNTSIINTNGSGVLTFQIEFFRFTGAIYFQGSVLSDFSIPYRITQSQNFTDHSGMVGVTVVGWHPFIRMVISNNGTIGVIVSSPSGIDYDSSYRGGDIESVLYR